MKKAIMYHRFSSKGQSECSIERQEKITSYWAEHNDVIIIDSFNDEGHSAKTFDRPDIKLLFAFIKKNHSNIDYLVVSELTRFSRELGDAVNMVKQIQSTYGIRIVSASRGCIYDIYEHTSFLQMGLEFLMGNTENIKRQNDINGGIYTSKVDGRWIQGGPAPFGYTKEGVGKERHLVIKEEQAAVIRFIFSEYLNNTPIYIITQQAKLKGLKRTSNSIVQEIISNPLFKSYQKVKPWKNHAGGLFPIKDLPKVIDDSTWQMANEKLNAKNKPRVAIADDFPLRQVVKCHCHLPLTGAPSKNRVGKYYNYYKCKVSGHNTIPAKKAHSQLIEVFQLMSLPDRLVKRIKEKSEILLSARLKESTEILNNKRIELEKAENNLTSIEEKFIGQQINFETYSKWHRTFSTERLQLRNSIEELQKDGSQTFFLLKNNLDRLSGLHNFYTESNTVQKQELIRKVFDSSLYYKEQSYRTPFVMPVFTHNLLTLKQKSLLFVDGWNENSGQVEAISLLSNTFLDFLTFLSTRAA